MENLQIDNSQRYERKYVIDPNKSWIFRNMLTDKKFTQVYSSRKVFSLYFDTIDHKFFKENIEGVGIRIKPRLRWYLNKNDTNESSIHTILELKRSLTLSMLL